MKNPFFIPYTTPYCVPPFDIITLDHIKEGIHQGIAHHLQEIESIKFAPNEPSFDNVVLALEQSGAILERVTSVMFNLMYAHTSPELQTIVQENAPKITAHYDSIFMDTALYTKIDLLWNQRETMGLNSQDIRLIEMYHRQFVNNGVQLDDAQKQRLSQINQSLSTLSIQFANNLLEEINRYKLVITNPDDLKGLPSSSIDAARETAIAAGHENAWVFTLQNTSIIPFLTFAENRELRRELWEGLSSKGDKGDQYDNKSIIIETLQLREEKAKILGQTNYANLVLKDRMAKNADNVNALLDQLWQGIQPLTTSEHEEIAQLLNKDGYDGDVQPYDWRYYAEKIKKLHFDFDEEAVRPYFSLENVVDGMFDVAHKLYGIHFEKLENMPIYHPDVTVYLVKERDGKETGILYMDYFPRESKQGGAWMTSYVNQSYSDNHRVLPVISIVCNFTKPIGDQPSLLTMDEVNTLFHEFGHALHGLLSDVKYKTLAGTNVPTDFVELPSQIMENWATDPAVLKMYAKHYQTGETVPDSLIQKILDSDKHGNGFALTEYLAASILDMHFHSTPSSDITSIRDFESAIWAKINLPQAIISRYKSTYFSHIFGGGYAVGYYSYIWSEVLDADAYAAFVEKGIFDQTLAQSFRDNILSQGGNAEPDELYRRFMKRDPSIEPLLAKKGISNPN